MKNLSLFGPYNEELMLGQSETRPWGKWTILNEGPTYKVKLIEVSPGYRLSLQFHHFRAEHWLVVSGRARVFVANRYYELGEMQTAVIPERTIHRIENHMPETLKIIEVQMGDDLSEEDIVRLDDDYEREVFTGGFNS